MKFEYFSGKETASNCYFIIPKALQTEPELKKLSVYAKYLYGLMLDRMKLSWKNNQVDKEGRAYIYYSTESIQQELGVGRNTVFKLLEELDTDNGIGLIERVKLGQGKISRIYVMRIVEAEQEFVDDEYAEEDAQKFNNWDSEEKEEDSEVQNVNFKKFKNGTSRSLKSNTLEVYDQDSDNKNNINKNNYNKNLIHIYPSNSADVQADGMGLDRDEIATRLYVREDIGTDELCSAYPHWESKVRGIEDVLVDVLTSRRNKITIAGEERDLNTVKGRFMKLNRFQLETVIDNWSRLKKAPNNPRAYLLAMLFNVSGTADIQFEAECNEGAQNNFQKVAENYDNTDYEEYMEG